MLVKITSEPVNKLAYLTKNTNFCRKVQMIFSDFEGKVKTYDMYRNTLGSSKLRLAKA